MVDQEKEPIIQSEESQTVFEGHQTVMQAPPLARKEMTFKQKIGLIGSALVMVMIIVFISLASRSNDQVVRIKKSEPSPTPTPIYIDPAKENELKRVETIVQSTNPEDLLIPPPQVNMAITF